MKLNSHIALMVGFVVCFSAVSTAQQDDASKRQSPAPIAYGADNWKVFRAIESGFQVRIPGKPDESTVELETAAGKLPHHMYLLRTDAAKFLVTSTEFPGLPDDPAEIRMMLSALHGDGTKGRNEKVLSEREIKIEGYTGREFLIEVGANIIRSRAFMTRSRVYEIMLYMSTESAFKTSQPGADPSNFSDFFESIGSQFFDSFKLMSVITGTSVSETSTARNNRNKIVKGVVINGKATEIPKPTYPDSARSSGAQGTVEVKVLIDERGSVIEAKAISGDPRLYAAAENAARSARFTPTKLEGVPVKVTGIIRYNFKLM